MRAPKYKTFVDDDVLGVRFIILAHRPLTKREAMMHVRLTVAASKRKPKRGTEITIHTVID